MDLRQNILAALEPLNLSIFVGAGDSPLSWSVKVEYGSPTEAIVVVNHRLSAEASTRYRKAVHEALHNAGFTQTPLGGWAQSSKSTNQEGTHEKSN